MDLTKANEALSGWSGGTSTVFGLFLDLFTGNSAISLNTAGLSMGVFEQAVANIAYLRAQSGGGMSRLNFAAESLSSMETNMRAAIGRVEDVDIACRECKPGQVLNPNTSIRSDGGPGQLHQRCGSDAPTIREELTCKRKSHR